MHGNECTPLPRPSARTDAHRYELFERESFRKISPLYFVFPPIPILAVAITNSSNYKDILKTRCPTSCSLPARPRRTGKLSQKRSAPIRASCHPPHPPQIPVQLDATLSTNYSN